MLIFYSTSIILNSFTFSLWLDLPMENCMCFANRTK